MASFHFPSFRRHVGGQGVVTVRLIGGGRKDIYCGPFGTVEAKREYKRILAILDANDGKFPEAGPGITINEALLLYLRRFAEKYYTPGTSSIATVKRVIRTLRQMYGPEPTASFGPKALRLVMEKWVSEGLARRSVNKMAGVVKRAWRWMVAEELLPAECRDRLLAVEGLRLGRTLARDNPPIRPAILADVETVLPFMPPVVADLVRLQLLTAARGGELLGMKAADIDRSGEIWVFRPPSHKGSWRGKGRSIFVGFEGQRILAPYLLRAGDGFLFSPARSEADRIAERSADRKTPRWKSHMRRNEEKRVGDDRARPPRDTYDSRSYYRAVRRACEKAGVSMFRPHQLRHAAVLKIRTTLGLEFARACAGHSVAGMTEHYSRSHDEGLAAEAARKIG
jgi:integrase